MKHVGIEIKFYNLDTFKKQTDANFIDLDSELVDLNYKVASLIFCHFWRSIIKLHLWYFVTFGVAFPIRQINCVNTRNNYFIVFYYQFGVNVFCHDDNLKCEVYSVEQCVEIQQLLVMKLKTTKAQWKKLEKVICLLEYISLSIHSKYSLFLRPVHVFVPSFRHTLFRCSEISKLFNWYYNCAIIQRL